MINNHTIFGLLITRGHEELIIINYVFHALVYIGKEVIYREWPARGSASNMLPHRKKGGKRIEF